MKLASDAADQVCACVDVACAQAAVDAYTTKAGELMAAVNIGKETLEYKETEQGAKLRVRLRPDTALPGFMKKIVGNRNEYEEVREWDKSKLGNHWTIDPSFPIGKIDIQGTLTIKDSGDHQCTRVVEGTFSVGIPLVGGKIEKFIIGQTEDSFKKSTAWTIDYIKKNKL